MHGIHETQALLDPALLQTLLDLRGDVNELGPILCFEPQLFAIALHVVQCSARVTNKTLRQLLQK